MKTIATLVFVFILPCQSITFSLRELQTNIQSSRNEFMPSNSDNGGCAVIKNDAGCCQRIDLDPVHLHTTICVNVTFLPKAYGFSLTLTVGGKTIINETVSARSPPALCADVPELEEIASICIKFHDLDISKTAVKGCVKIVIELVYITIDNIELGCFTIPLKGEGLNLTNRGVLRYQEPILGKGNIVYHDVKYVAKKDYILRELLRKRYGFYRYFGPIKEVKWKLLMFS